MPSLVFLRLHCDRWGGEFTRVPSDPTGAEVYTETIRACASPRPTKRTTVHTQSTTATRSKTTSDTVPFGTEPLQRLQPTALKDLRRGHPRGNTTYAATVILRHSQI